MLYRISCIIILVLFVDLFTGCDHLDGYKDEDMEIEAASIVSISDDSPAEVVIGAFGSNNDGCVKPYGKVYANRDGNNIHLTGKKEIPLDSGYCNYGIWEVYGEVTVKNLEMGEYKIVGYNSRELQRFRVELDAVYVGIEPIINDFIISPIVPDNIELEYTFYHVKVGISIGGFYEIGCEPILNTDVESTGDIINIDMWCVVPNTDSGCDIVIDPYQTHLIPPYNTEIDLGTFSVGSYSVVINGGGYLFHVPLHIAVSSSK